MFVIADVAECNCFGHATECVYNQTVADRRLSLNIYGEYEGGGVCVDCQVGGSVLELKLWKLTWKHSGSG